MRGSARKLGLGGEELDVGVVQLLREAVAADLACDQHARARCEPVLEGLDAAEPLQLHGARAVGHDRLEEAPAVAQRDDTAACHLPGEHRRAPHLELLDRHDVAPVLVGARQEEEQVLDGRDLLARERLGGLRADARHARHGLREPALGKVGRQHARE